MQEVLFRAAMLKAFSVSDWTVARSWPPSMNAKSTDPVQDE